VAVALSLSERKHPPLTLIRQQIAASDDDLLAFVSAAMPSVLAIDAPLSLPASVVAALAGETAPPHTSPYTRATERDPIWQTLGVRPFPVSFLGGLTFRAIVVAQRMRQRYPKVTVIEAFPTAAFAILGLRISAQGAIRHVRKSSPEARRHIQQGLASYVAGLPVPDDTLLTADTLDAIGAALSAYAFVIDCYTAVGDASEGQIILPGSDLVSLAG
jgi:predicted nuclease with RNAse H fold